MIFYGVLCLVLGVIAYAFHRGRPQSQPVSTVLMYIGLGVGAILLVTGIAILATRGDAIEVDSLGSITVR
jgi:uncharacterized membrane protein